ncbi:hypothetical protein D3C75_726020 [compost metagenome]
MQQAVHDARHKRPDDVIRQNTKHEKRNERDQHRAKQRLQRLAKFDLTEVTNEITNRQAEHDRAQESRARLRAE